MIKKEIFVDGENEHNITIEKQKKKTIYTLFYSNGEQWSADVRGEIAMQVIDDGNELKITQKSKNKLDYSEALYLSILFREIHSNYKFEQAIKEEF